ncbi:hypothetical protein BM1_00734 [Bipolaris maydis]|nr:hypothetical protein BM1_00734 [Bipolaris maydis]
MIEMLRLRGQSPIRSGDDINRIVPQFGGGNVYVEDPERYPYLLDPIIPDQSFIVAWSHQLHCIFYIMSEYDRILRHGPNGKERSIPPGSYSVHTRHCFEILRQSVLCHLDMTLEGAQAPVLTGTTGFGHARVCQNRQEAIDWMEKNRNPGVREHPDSVIQANQRRAPRPTPDQELIPTMKQ